MDPHNIKHVEAYSRISYEVSCATLAALRMLDEAWEALRASKLACTKENIPGVLNAFWANSPLKPRSVHLSKNRQITITTRFGNTLLRAGGKEISPGIFEVRFLMLNYHNTLRVFIPHFQEESPNFPFPTWSEANGATPCVIAQKVVSEGAHAGLLQAVTAFGPCTKMQCHMTAPLALYCNKPLTNVIRDASIV